MGEAQTSTLGIVHDECLIGPDRVLGTISNELFEKHPELVNFDINGWFHSATNGQIVLSNLSCVSSDRNAVIAWNGNIIHRPLGDFVVEIALLNGDREIVTVRNDVQRFDILSAREFSDELNAKFQAQQQINDPMCYSNETKAFGPRSQLLELIGTKEVLRAVDKARHRRYDAIHAARYSRPGHWYAPLLYLQCGLTDQPVGKMDTVFLLSRPLEIKSFLESWVESGVIVDGYQTQVILTDREFDDFMAWNEYRDFSAIIDPVLDPATGDFLSGIPIGSFEVLKGLLD